MDVCMYVCIYVFILHFLMFYISSCIAVLPSWIISLQPDTLFNCGDGDVRTYQIIHII